MIWFQSRKLELKISKNLLSENDGYLYLLATCIYGYILALYSSRVPYTYIHLIIVLAHIVITIIALPIIFKINSNLDDKDFLKRFLAITWIIRIKLLIWFVVSTLVYYNIVGMNISRTAQIIYVISNSVLSSLLYYVLTIRSFKRLKPL
jgi:hypothetical protein